MTHHDARRIASEAGFRPLDTGADIVVAAHDARGIWLSMRQSGGRWTAYLDSRDRLLARAEVSDEVALRAVLTRELSEGGAK